MVNFIRLIGLMFIITLISCNTNSKQGADYFRDKDYEQALFHFDLAYKLYPNDVYLIYNLARTHEELENFDDAIKYFNLYLEKSTDKLPGFLGRGRCYFGKGYLEGAEIDFTNAIRLDQGSFDAFYMRGRTRVKMRKFSRGISDLSNALSIDEEHVRSYYYRGIAFAGVGQFSSAIDDLSFVIEEEPEILQAYYNRAFCHEQLRNLPKAIEDYSTALEQNPGYTNALLKRGICYLNLGVRQPACEDFTSLSELKDKRADSYLRRFCRKIKQLSRS